MKFGLFSTDPELEKLQRGFAAGAVVSQTQYIFSVCKKGTYLSGSFVKNRSARNAQSFLLLLLLFVVHTKKGAIKHKLKDESERERLHTRKMRDKKFKG